MGGSESYSYKQFLSLCCSCYNVLRKYANLILYLLMLMIDANIPDITGVPGSDPLKNIMKVQEKFKLELNDEEAAQFMQATIHESEKAMFPKLHDQMHRWAQYWRS
jgi:phosphatidylinositol 3-kinase